MKKYKTREEVCEGFLKVNPDDMRVRMNCLFCIHEPGWKEYRKERSEGKCQGCKWNDDATEKSNFKYYKSNE